MVDNFGQPIAGGYYFPQTTYYPQTHHPSAAVGPNVSGGKHLSSVILLPKIVYANINGRDRKFKILEHFWLTAAAMELSLSLKGGREVS